MDAKENRVDSVVLAISKKVAIDQRHRKFMEFLNQLMVSLPESDQDKLLDFESNMNEIFNLGCQSAYQHGLREGRRMNR